jgi:solute carrier family 50 protein (sugar transporter)
MGFTFGVVQMAVYMFYMNKTPVLTKGKEADKNPMPTEEHVVVNITKLSSTVPEKSSEMAVPRMNCAAEAAAAMTANSDQVDVIVNPSSTNQVA